MINIVEIEQNKIVYYKVIVQLSTFVEEFICCSYEEAEQLADFLIGLLKQIIIEEEKIELLKRINENFEEFWRIYYEKMAKVLSPLVKYNWTDFIIEMQFILSSSDFSQANSVNAPH